VIILKHNQIKAAADIVRSGGIIIYPTDTVWGIGCDARKDMAVKRILEIKQKPIAAPLVWLLPCISAVSKYFPNITLQEKKLLNKRRTTVVLGDIAVRIVKTGWVNKFIAACGGPVISTSANLHGEKPVNSWRQAERIFESGCDAIIRGSKIYNRQPSTVACVKNGEIKILRKGGGISIK
jgi:L-threonylcarbamoyladenylate synthase